MHTINFRWGASSWSRLLKSIIMLVFSKTNLAYSAFVDFVFVDYDF